MFRPYSVTAARQSTYLNKEVEFPPRSQLDCKSRQKMTNEVLDQICYSHPTNKIPKGAKDTIRQTFTDLEVSRDLQWLEESIGDSGWLFMYGLYNKKHPKPSKLILGSAARRVVILDLRTLSSSGGLPDVVRGKVERGYYLPVGENIKTLLEDLNLSTHHCLDTLEITARIISDQQNMFRLPPGTVGGLILDHWVLGCLWFEEFLGYATKEEFGAFEAFFPHPQVRYWPWSKDDTSKFWGILMTGCQVSFARNHILLDLVALLTYSLQELGSERVWVGPEGHNPPGTLQIPLKASWGEAAKLIVNPFRKSGVYPGRKVDLLAPRRPAPLAEAVQLALTIDTMATAKEECRAIDSLLKYCDELKRKEVAEAANKYVPEAVGAGPKGPRSVFSRLGKRESSKTDVRSPPTKRGYTTGSGRSRSRSSSTGRSSTSSVHHAVPEGPALVAALPFGDAEAPEGAQTVVWPRRYQSSPSLGIHCPYCGQRKAKRHRTLENCEEYQAKRAKFGVDMQQWPEKSCSYAYCRDPKTHKTKICPWLHALCLQCRVRGHATGEECNRDNLALQVAYNEVAAQGLLSGAFSRDPHWQFAPKSPDLGEVVFLGKIHKVDWTPSQFEEYRVADDEERRRLLSHEYHR